MNDANGHMSEGVDPQADSCDPPHERESQQIFVDYGTQAKGTWTHIGPLEAISQIAK